MTKVVIVGGVAGGASCAARLRRLDEQAEIVMVERGPYVSFANCGLPYHVGGVIEREASLLVASEKTFRENFAIDVRPLVEAVALAPRDKTVTLRDVRTGVETTESYDKLVLAPGGAAIRPPFPGIDLPGIFELRTVPDARAMKAWLDRPAASGRKLRAVVVGGGFIGLETAENLRHRGVDVTVVEMGQQVLAPLDAEMARLAEQHLEAHGVRLVLGDGVAGFARGDDDALRVETQGGQRFGADIVLLALGVKPEATLARAAGLDIGARGGIRVDDRMVTSDPDILAVGDAVEVRDAITGEWTLMALAGPANRQGRIAAEVIAGRPSRFRGVQGTSIVGLFGAAAAWTGASEKTLQRAGITDYGKVHLFPNAHAGYYPGAKTLHLKLLYRPSDGRVLGGQAFSLDAAGADKRISALAMAIQMAATIDDLAEAELCYAPQFGSAKDALNFAGMIARSIVSGDMPATPWDTLPADAFIIDVREAHEIAQAAVPGALHIPLRELRGRLTELPRDRTIFVNCRSGQRAYLATRILLQNGFDARDIQGGMLARAMLAVA